MTSPNREDVQPGKKITLPSGEVTLVRKEAGNMDHIPYIKKESDNPVQAPTCYIWTKERWLVEYPDGFRTHRYIDFFLFIRTQHPSGVFRSEFDEEDDRLANYGGEDTGSYEEQE